MKFLSLFLVVVLVGFVGAIDVPLDSGSGVYNGEERINNWVTSITNLPDKRSYGEVFLDTIDLPAEFRQKVWDKLDPEIRSDIWTSLKFSLKITGNNNDDLTGTPINNPKLDEDRTDLLRSLSPEQRQEFLKQIIKENNGREISLKGLDKIDAENIEYKDGQLIITANGGSKHIIPLENIPKDVKEISFQEVTELGQSEFTGVVYDGKDENQVFLGKGYIEADEKGNWVVKGLGGEYKDRNPIINFKDSKNARVEFGKLPESRGGGEGVREGFHMWRGNGEEPVTIQIGDRTVFPHPEGDGTGSKGGAYGFVSILGRSTFGLRGVMQTKEISLSMYHTDNGIVSFDSSYKGEDGKDWISIVKDGKDKKVTGTAGGFVDFRIDSDLENKEVKVNYADGGGFELLEEGEEGKSSENYGNKLYVFETVGGADVYVDRDSESSYTLDEEENSRVVANPRLPQIPASDPSAPPDLEATTPAGTTQTGCTGDSCNPGESVCGPDGCGTSSTGGSCGPGGCGEVGTRVGFFRKIFERIGARRAARRGG